MVNFLWKLFVSFAVLGACEANLGIIKKTPCYDVNEVTCSNGNELRYVHSVICSALPLYDDFCANFGTDNCICVAVQRSFCGGVGGSSKDLYTVGRAAGTTCNDMETAGLFSGNLFICNNLEYENGCVRLNRRRDLLELETTNAASDKETIDRVLNKCGQHDYEASIQVLDGHLYAIALPKQQQQLDHHQEQCPLVVAQTVYENNHSLAKKQLWVFKNVDQMVNVLFQQGSLPIGTFKLQDLADAYHEADAGPAATAAVPMTYDIMKNNCGNLIVSLASALGVEIDSRMTLYVARRLVEQSGKQLADKIRKSLDYFALIGGHHDTRNLRGGQESDEELVELLVETHASRLLV